MRIAIVIIVIVGLVIGGYKLFEKRFGDKPIAVQASDEDMNKAIATARESVDEFISQLSTPKENWHYMVKFKVEDGDEVEHLWADPVAYKDGKFRGVIANTPYKVHSIKKGDVYTASKDQISDWLITDDKGNVKQGGWTDALLN